jgi:phosphoribosylformimino-5-aminoimidazole carboxamide ribotide isomerase
MRIIPAIDIIEGKCVRLSKGKYSTKKIYNENPLDMAKTFEDCGFKYLHLVDLDGAKARKIINYKVLENLSSKTNLKIDFGGGLKSNNDLKIAFESGADQITGGSIALTNPELFKTWIDNYGQDKIILGADVKNENIAINAWDRISENKVEPFINNYLKYGIKYVICTDIDKDGMLNGPSFKLYEKIIKNNKMIKLIASGGVSKISDLPILSKLGCEGVIIGKAIYENKVSLKDLSNFNF